MSRKVMKRTIIPYLRTISGLPEEIIFIADRVFREIIEKKLEEENKDLLFKGLNGRMFAYQCTLQAYSIFEKEIHPETLAAMFKLNKCAMMKSANLVSIDRIGKKLISTPMSEHGHYQRYIDSFNSLSPEDMAKISFVETGAPLVGMRLNEDFLESVIKFSKIVMEINPDLRTGSTGTSRAGIFLYFIRNICGLKITNPIMHLITGYSYATDRKNIEATEKAWKIYLASQE